MGPDGQGLDLHGISCVIKTPHGSGVFFAGLPFAFWDRYAIIKKISFGGINYEQS